MPDASEPRGRILASLFFSLLASVAPACVVVTGDRPEPLPDGSVPYPCGLDGQPCCQGVRCDDGTTCRESVPALVEQVGFTETHREVASSLAGLAKTVTYDAACPEGMERVDRFEVSTTLVKGASGTCTKLAFVSSDPHDCSVQVMVSAAAAATVDCTVQVYAMLPDTNAPRTLCRSYELAPPPAVCGDNLVQPGENCDDANVVDGDGCSAACRFESFCGDGTRASAEACDDGNVIDRDGCSAVCGVEACGNGVLDTTEHCDGPPPCASDCSAASTCGNGTVDAGESCDDANLVALDGCSPACVREHAMVFRRLQLLTPDRGLNHRCDFTGDGYTDALINDALSFVGAAVSVASGDLFATSPHGAAVLLGLDDASLGTDDPSVLLATVALEDTNGNTADDLGGSASLRVANVLVTDGHPNYAQRCSVAGGQLECLGGDFRLPFVRGLDALVRRAEVRIPLVPTAVSGVATVAPGTVGTSTQSIEVCGVLPVRIVAGYPNPFVDIAGAAGITLPSTPCAANLAANQVTVADFLVSGSIRVADDLPLTYAAQPDADLDGDGLEYYVIAPSTAACQGSILACVDGDGTVIDGHDCATDPRMADGWSLYGVVQATTALVVP